MLNIQIFRYVKICTLERSVFYYTEAVVLRYSVKMCSKTFAKFTKKHLCWSLLVKEETPTQALPCKFRENSEKNFSYRTSPVVASVIQPC